MLCPSDHSVMGGHAVSYFRRHRGKTRRRAEDRNWTRLTQPGHPRVPATVGERTLLAVSCVHLAYNKGQKVLHRRHSLPRTSFENDQ